MKIIFLDIDGVLNNCMAAGVFHETSTIESCIGILNEVIIVTEASVIIISSWKDNFDSKVVTDLLYSRGVYPDSIIGAIPKGVPKEEGIQNFLRDNHVTNFVIIDDKLPLSDESLKNFVVEPSSYEGLQLEHIEQITKYIE